MIVDASVVVKWFYEEAETPAALRLFDRIAHREIRAVVPDLLFYEFANVLKGKGQLERFDVEEALSTLFELPWSIIEPDAYFMSDALALAERYGISVYDAAYVALAFDWNTPLITADEKLRNAVGSERIQLLREYL